MRLLAGFLMSAFAVAMDAQVGPQTWVNQLVNESTRDEATRQLIAHADESIPVLLDTALANRNDTLTNAAADVLGKIGARAVTPTIDRMRSETANLTILGSILARIGRPAIVGLAAHLNAEDMGFRRRVEAAIGWFEKDTDLIVPQLVTAIQQPEADTQSLLSALTTAGAAAFPARSVAVRMLESPNEEIALNAALMLGALSRDGAPGVDAIARRFINARDAGLRASYAEVLGQIGPPAKKSEGALVEILTRTVPRTPLAITILDTLRKIGATSDAAKSLIRASDADAKRRASASIRLAAIGNETSHLIEALDEREPNLRDAIVGALAARVPAINDALLEVIPRHPDLAVRVGAAEVLSRRQLFPKITTWAFAQAFRSGDQALVLELLEALRGQREEVETLIQAIQDFVRASHDRATREAALRYLISISPPGQTSMIPFYVEGLSADDRWMIAASISALRSYGPEATSATPRLIQLTSDRDAEIRNAAVITVINVGYHDPTAVAAISKALSTSPVDVQESWLREMQICGGCALGFADVLRSLITTAASTDVRAQSASVLLNATERSSRFDIAVELFSVRAARGAATGPLAERPEEALPVVFDAFIHSQGVERAELAESLKSIISQSPREPRSVASQRLVETAVSMLSDGDRKIRIAGLTLAVRMRAHTASVAPRVAALLDDPDDEVRKLAVDTLIGLGTHLAAAPMLGSSSMRAVRAASDVLSRAGRLPADLAPALEAGALSGDAYVRRNSIAALLRSFPNGGDALARVASHASGDVRREVIRDLGRPHVWTSASALATLIDGLSDDDSEIARAAAWSLGEWGPRGQAALPNLTAALGHSDLSVRYAAGRAIRRVDGFSSRALIEALRSETVMIRVGAAEALGLVFDRAAEARGPLARAANDDDISVRNAATTALTRISTRLRYAYEVQPLGAISNPSPLIPEGKTMAADLIVGADGRVQTVILRQGVTAELNAIATVVMGRWRFQPPLDLSGAPATVQITVVIGADKERL